MEHKTRWHEGKRNKQGHFVRYGKTAAERSNKNRRRENQLARNEYVNNSKARAGDFPWHTLGGKGTSSKPFKMIAGKGRRQV